MIKKSFIEKIDDETLAAMIDKTLNYEKRYKAQGWKANIFKLVPAVAVIALVIGFANSPGSFSDINMGANGNNAAFTGASAEVREETQRNLDEQATRIMEENAERKEELLRNFNERDEIMTERLARLRDQIGDSNLAFREFWSEESIQHRAEVERIVAVIEKAAEEARNELEAEKARIVQEHMTTLIEANAAFMEHHEKLIAEMAAAMPSFIQDSTVINDIQTIRLYDGTTIIAPTSHIVAMTNNTGMHISTRIGRVTIHGGATVILLNGTIINIPENTNTLVITRSTEFREIEIRLRNGGAAITLPDGTSTTVPRGAILDGEGNIRR